MVPCDKERVLIVDDESVIRRLFEMVLSWGLPGKTIEVAADGAEAVKRFTEHHHAVLLMDLHMPVMDGHSAFTTIQELCTSEAWEMPRVVFCTGYAPPNGVREIVSSTTDHCLLSKPVSNDELVDAVRVRLEEATGEG